MTIETSAGIGLAAYLNRIGYSGRAEPTLDVL